MLRKPLDDETLADPLKLLAEYRELCELTGGHRTTHSTFPREARERLQRVEAELQARLWLAGRQQSAVSNQPPADGEQRAASSRRRQVEPSLPPSPIPHPLSPAAAAVFTDGACIGNPGPGGYAAIVRVPGKPERVLTGGKARTTNNEMEMTGAIEGLKAAISEDATEIEVFSDSEYLVKGMNSWMKGWLRNGWKTRTGDPVKNRALWEDLHRLTQGRAVTWTWVAGHAGHPENERCDSLAVAAASSAAGHK